MVAKQTPASNVAFPTQNLFCFFLLLFFFCLATLKDIIAFRAETKVDEGAHNALWACLHLRLVVLGGIVIHTLWFQG